MRINELILENQETDEAISLGGIGRGIAKGVGGTAKAVGATVGGVAGAWQAAKQGYRAGKAAVSGNKVDTTGTTPTAASPTAATVTTADPASVPSATTSAATPATGGAPAAPTSGTSVAARPATAAVSPTVGQINSIIPKLRARDLQSIKKNLDAIIAQKTAGRPAVAPGTPTMNVVQGGAGTQQSQAAVPESVFYSKFLDKAL